MRAGLQAGRAGSAGKRFRPTEKRQSRVDGQVCPSTLLPMVRPPAGSPYETSTNRRAHSSAPRRIRRIQRACGALRPEAICAGFVRLAAGRARIRPVGARGRAPSWPPASLRCTFSGLLHAGGIPERPRCIFSRMLYGCGTGSGVPVLVSYGSSPAARAGTSGQRSALTCGNAESTPLERTRAPSLGRRRGGPDCGGPLSQTCKSPEKMHRGPL